MIRLILGLIKGEVMSEQHEMVGKVFPTNNGGDCVVVEYINATKVEVQFLDDFGYTVQTDFKSVRNGNVRNYFSKSVYGVGYLGVGKYKSVYLGKRSKVYKIWASILQRCYSDLGRTVNPTYKDCTVCEEWHNFQNFAEWYTNQDGFGLGYHLDKDLLSPKGYKIYSPDTCCLIPREINNLFNDSKSTRKDMPQGVRKSKETGKFFAQLSVGTGKRLHFGSYDSKDMAYSKYKKEKENYVKQVALKWKGEIPEKVFNKLMNWTLN